MACLVSPRRIPLPRLACLLPSRRVPACHGRTSAPASRPIPRPLSPSNTSFAIDNTTLGGETRALSPRERRCEWLSRQQGIPAALPARDRGSGRGSCRGRSRRSEAGPRPTRGWMRRRRSTRLSQNPSPAGEESANQAQSLSSDSAPSLRKPLPTRTLLMGAVLSPGRPLQGPTQGPPRGSGKGKGRGKRHPQGHRTAYRTAHLTAVGIRTRRVCPRLP